MTPITDERCLDLARKYEQHPCSGRSVTLRDHGIVEFARALIAEHEASKMVPPAPAEPRYVGQPSPGAAIALAESERGEA